MEKGLLSICPCPLLHIMSAFTLSSSSELSLCLLPDKNFTNISLSQSLSSLNSLSEVTLNDSFHSSSHTFTMSHCDFDRKSSPYNTQNKEERLTYTAYICLHKGKSLNLQWLGRRHDIYACHTQKKLHNMLTHDTHLSGWHFEVIPNSTFDSLNTSMLPVMPSDIQLLDSWSQMFWLCLKQQENEQ
jgi:hypothetical protein